MEGPDLNGWLCAGRYQKIEDCQIVDSSKEQIRLEEDLEGDLDPNLRVWAIYNDEDDNDISFIRYAKLYNEGMYVFTNYRINLISIYIFLIQYLLQ